MSDQTTLRTSPSTSTSPSSSPHRRARRAAAGAMLGALVITGPWTVPAAGHNAAPDAGRAASRDGAAREAFPGAPGPLAPQRPFHELFGARDAHGGLAAYDLFGFLDEEFFDDERLFLAPHRSTLAAATRTSPVSAYPISAAYGIPGSWAAGHHTGVDFAAPTGTTVYSVGPGTVVEAGYDGDYGNAVLVKLTDGYYALYAHLSEISVEAEERVETGTELGVSGSTGRSTGPHLHFEIRTGPGYGSDVDPLAYLAGHGVSVV